MAHPGFSSVVAVGGFSELHEARYSKQTARRYKDAVLHFVEWVAARGDDFSTVQELDVLASAYISFLYRRNRQRSPAAGVNLRYGLQMLMPEIKPIGLPITDQALKGWARLRPGKSWPPIPLSAVQAVAAHLSELGELRAAVGILLAFECYLRPSELLALCPSDIMFPDDRRIHVGRRLDSPPEPIIRLQHTKTGRDQSVTVRDSEIQRLLRVVVDETADGERLFPYKHATLRRLFQQGCAALHMEHNGFVLHSLRHGGATLDYASGRLKLEDIMLRGRWEASKSARRYIQRGRALLLGNEIPDAVCNLIKILSSSSLAESLLQLSTDRQ